MKVKVVLSIAVLAFALSAATQGQIITSVVRSGGASGDRAPIGAYTGSTQPMATQEGGLKDGNYFFSDRTFTWTATPNTTLGPLNEPIIGAEYIRTFNSDKSNRTTVQYAVTISKRAVVFVTVDERFADKQAYVDFITDRIGQAGTFQDTDKSVFINEGDPPQRRLHVFAAQLAEGTYVFDGPSSGDNNFYVIGAVSGDPNFNPAPVVDAGADTSTYVGVPVQLNGAVSDEDPLEGDEGELSWYWYKASGPGTVTFEPSDTTNILNPTATFSEKGVYELMLQATDGDKDANDVVTILVRDRADEFVVAYYPLDGDGLDASGNGFDLASRGDTFFADGVFDQAASFDGAGDDMIQADAENPIGDALNGLSGISVSCWVKSNIYDTDKGFINFQYPTDGDAMGMRYDEQGSSGGGDAVLKMAVTTSGGVPNLETSNRSQTTNWQHVVMTWQGAERIRAYIDGVEEAYTAQSGVSPANAVLAGFESLFLGRGGKDVDVDNHGWNGLIDDVRIYNHALALEDEPEYDSVRSLTAMGPVVAKVEAGADREFDWRPGRELELNGQITDYGRPSTISVEWSTESGPNGAQATFTPSDSAATMVGFPEGGVYVLKLSVLDDDVLVVDTVRATVLAPTCADVKTDGLVRKMDLDADCYVGLSDLAILVSNWLECNDPADIENCKWAWGD